MHYSKILALVLLMTAPAAIAAAQGCACASFSPSVTITVSEDSGNAAKVDRPTVCITKAGTVTFQSNEGDIEVSFNKGDGTPFDFPRLRRAAGQRLAARITIPNTQQCGKSFRYSVKLTKAGRTLVLDPEIIVEPGQ